MVEWSCTRLTIESLEGYWCARLTIESLEEGYSTYTATFLRIWTKDGESVK